MDKDGFWYIEWVGIDVEFVDFVCGFLVLKVEFKCFGVLLGIFIEYESNGKKIFEVLWWCYLVINLIGWGSFYGLVFMLIWFFILVGIMDVMCYFKVVFCLFGVVGLGVLVVFGLVYYLMFGLLCVVVVVGDIYN